eukprot:8287928-Pyramimonas_sp.AAC.1
MTCRRLNHSCRNTPLPGPPLAEAWLDHVRAPTGRERPLACAHEAEPPPAGSQRMRIVSDSQFGGTTMRSTDEGCSEESDHELQKAEPLNA